MQTKSISKENKKIVDAYTPADVLNFFGWTKRLRNSLNLFVAPMNDKDHPNL